MQRYFGCGEKTAWVDVVQVSKERKKRTFHGFTLYNGQVFGADRKSPFVLTNIVERSDGKSGVYATILLWRFDCKAGWILQWERSVTTVNAIDMYIDNCIAHNWRVKITRESAESKVNPLQEVKGQKYFQPIC